SALRKPSVVVVMGVSGSGKSTIALMLAHRLNWIFEEGDWFHPPSNIEKMHRGEPLTDEDRWPWLEGIAPWVAATRPPAARHSPMRTAGPGWRAFPLGSTRLGAPAIMAPWLVRPSNAPIAISWSASAPTSASSI